ncbi:hypothetical protein Ccrd_005902 [Cynara cardunculus var. scolymus]|uniref:HMA domain-containing protein n=1 Tax=Cynara cardunculus var. scolymus TaxID=59895 RepID=A0A118JV14_CYNCS|nr:hypothetical protein Ccrd_005902 [Cynara cardunculus var. scolymus]
MVEDPIVPLTTDVGRPTTGQITSLVVVEVTPPKQASIIDTDLRSPLSQFWTSPTVIAEVDRASNEKSIQLAKQSRRLTHFAQKEKVGIGSLRSQAEKVGIVRGRSSDQAETRTSKVCKRGGSSDRAIELYGGIDPPSFDLGISPAGKEVVAIGDELNTSTMHDGARPTLSKRDSNLSFKLRSPYVARAVTFDVTVDERKLQDWIMRGIGGILEPVFVTQYGRTVTRQAMQSLATQSVVCQEVMDGWSIVLNRYERLRSDDSPRRYFFPTDVSMNHTMREQTLDVHHRYKVFKNNISCWTNNDRELISMRNLDMVFFPIVEDSLYYLIVFNLKRPSIIDSKYRDGNIYEIYGHSTVVLQDMMILHLMREGHDAGKVYAEMDQEQISTRWQSHETSVDCGVIMMRNMETYFGADGGKWESGLYKESTKQKRQLRDLRSKYCSKIILSEENIRKMAIITDVERFIAMETSYNAKRTQQDIAVCRLRIKGMACPSCSESVERALSMVEGVKKAVVGLALEEAKINYDPNVINTNRIIEAVEDAGFGADLIGSRNDGTKCI